MSIFPSAMLAGLMVSCLHSADDIAQAATALALPARYTDHTPAFRAEEWHVRQATADGSTTVTYWVVRDGERHVAVYAPKMIQLDQITFAPDLAPTSLTFPSVYSWARLFGTRITTGIWLDHWGISGETHDFTFSGGGETLTLTVTDRWTEKRQGHSIYTYVLRVDPVFGYVWDIAVDTSLSDLPRDKKGEPKRQVEFFNMQPQAVSSPWPDEWQHDWTIAATGANGAQRWANNLVAGELSDRPQFGIREGGYIAFASGRDGWGVALSPLKTGGLKAINSTCNLWLDQHNHLVFAEPNAEGRYVAQARYRFNGLPPQLATHLIDAATLRFTGERSVMLRLGQVETFDDQPLALDTVARGMWTWGMEVSGAQARSGGKSLLIKGVSKADGNTGKFIAPFIPLDTERTYALRAWVFVEGENTEAFICHADPAAPVGAMKHRSTPRATATGEWQELVWRFSNRGQLDLRLVCIGPGRAFVDDFSLLAVE